MASGGMEVWRYGGMEVWRYGGKEPWGEEGRMNSHMAGQLV